MTFLIKYINLQKQKNKMKTSTRHMQQASPLQSLPMGSGSSMGVYTRDLFYR